MADDTLGQGLIEGMREVLAWKRGEIALEVVNLDPMPPERIKAIRKKAARSAAKFEARYGISAATVNNWEQGPQKTGPDRAPASQISRLLAVAHRQNSVPGGSNRQEQNSTGHHRQHNAKRPSVVNGTASHRADHATYRTNRRKPRAPSECRLHPLVGRMMVGLCHRIHRHCPPPQALASQQALSASSWQVNM